ncbi:unnamed protein product, partial [Rotaria sp. Silwood1]
MTIPNYLYITVFRLPNYANSSKDVLDETSHSSILLFLLSCLSSITCHPYRKQKDLISTSLSIPLATITTINNTTIVDDNEDEYYEDDIEQIESTTTVQQLNTINKNKNITNSNFFVIKIQVLGEYVIYLFDRFYLIFSNKLSEELFDDDLIEIINTSCCILVIELYSRNDSILGNGWAESFGTKCFFIFRPI